MKKSVVTLMMLLLLPAGLKALSAGLTTLQRSAGPAADLGKLQSELAAARAVVSAGRDPHEATIRTRYTIPRLEGEIAVEKSRRKYAEKRPAGYTWTGLGALLVICWCVTLHLLLAGLKGTARTTHH